MACSNSSMWILPSPSLLISNKIRFCSTLALYIFLALKYEVLQNLKLVVLKYYKTFVDFVEVAKLRKKI
jgi:hypothetical protein